MTKPMTIEEALRHADSYHGEEPFDTIETALEVLAAEVRRLHTVTNGRADQSELRGIAEYLRSLANNGESASPSDCESIAAKLEKML